MNHMIHNLTPTPTKVYITYDLDFVPATSPLAASMREIQTVWMDVVGGAYPVFDAKRGRHGGDRRLTYPDEVPGAPRRNTWTVPGRRRARRHRRATCTRAGCGRTSSSRAPAGRCGCSARRRSTTSPPGAVSWDVSMTATPPGLARADPARGRPERQRHLRHAARLLVRVDGDHAGDVPPRRDDREGPVHHQGRRARQGHARAPARERQPRRRALLRPARRPRPARPAARERHGHDPDPGLRLRAGRPQLARVARGSRRSCGAAAA